MNKPETPEEQLHSARNRRATLESAFLRALQSKPEERRKTFDLYVPKLAEVNKEIIEVTESLA